LMSQHSRARFQQPLINRTRHILPDDFFPTNRAYEASDHAGTDLGNPAWRHQEQSTNLRIQVTVDVAHCSLEFVITFRADAPENMRRSNVLSVVNQKPIGKRSHRNA